MRPLLLVLLLTLAPAKAVTLADVRASALEVTTLDGQKTALATLVGNDKPVVVAFWATWCAPCRRETPHFIQLDEEYRKNGLIILGLTMENYEKDVAKVKAYVDENRIRYTVAFASPSVYRLFRNSKGIGIPAVYVFARDGHLIEEFHGYTPLTTNHHIAAAVAKATGGR